MLPHGEILPDTVMGLRVIKRTENGRSWLEEKDTGYKISEAVSVRRGLKRWVKYVAGLAKSLGTDRALVARHGGIKRNDFEILIHNLRRYSISLKAVSLTFVDTMEVFRKVNGLEKRYNPKNKEDLEMAKRRKTSGEKSLYLDCLYAKCLNKTLPRTFFGRLDKTKMEAIHLGLLVEAAAPMHHSTEVRFLRGFPSAKVRFRAVYTE